MNLSKTALAICTIMLFSACGQSLVQYETYENLQQAKADGAVIRGWISEWMPRNAINIHERHDLDTSSQSISFEVAEPNLFRWPHMCKSTTNARRPKVKTSQFPPAAQKLDNIRECGEFFMVKDEDARIHMWRK